jgi:PAS domain S-box-containing protein
MSSDHSDNSSEKENPEFNYELFFDLSPDLIIIAGFDGYFKRVNPAMFQLLGYTKEELYSRPIDDFIHKNDVEATRQARKNIIKANTLFNFENRYVTKSGEVVWLAWTSHPVADNKLVFAIAKNITHKKQLEIERLALLEKLTKVNNDLKQFSLSTSHDLRSPIGNLMTVFDMLDKSKINDGETLELFEILKLTGESLAASLNNYVDVLSEKGSDYIETEEVYLEEHLNNVIKSIASLIASSKTSIKADFSKVQSVKFNKAYLESVFLNLITNSIRYSMLDTAPVITIRSEITDGKPQLLISDNGLGFDMNKVKGKIFGLNQTFHDNIESKGVGLYLVHSQITSLGGEIEVESKVNEGTRFLITFNS